MAEQRIQQQTIDPFSYTPTTFNVSTGGVVNVNKTSKGEAIADSLNKLLMTGGQAYAKQQEYNTQLVKQQTETAEDVYKKYITDNTYHLNKQAANAKAVLAKQVALNTDGTAGLDKLSAEFSTTINNLRDLNGNEIKDPKLKSALDIVISDTDASLQKERYAAFTKEERQKVEDFAVNTLTSGTVNINTYSDAKPENKQTMSDTFNHIVEGYANANGVTKGEAANHVFKMFIYGQMDLNENDTIDSINNKLTKVKQFASEIEGGGKKFLLNQTAMKEYEVKAEQFKRSQESFIIQDLETSMRVDGNYDEVNNNIDKAVTNKLISKETGDNYKDIYKQSQQSKLTNRELYLANGGVTSFDETVNSEWTSYYKEDVINHIITTGNFDILTQTFARAPKTATNIIETLVSRLSTDLGSQKIKTDPITGQPLKDDKGNPILISFKEKATKMMELSKIASANSFESLSKKTITELLVVSAISDVYGEDNAKAQSIYEQYKVGVGQGKTYYDIPLDKDTHKEIKDTVPSGDIHTVTERIQLIKSITNDEGKAKELVLSQLKPIDIGGIGVTTNVLNLLSRDYNNPTKYYDFSATEEKTGKRLNYFMEGLRLYISNTDKNVEKAGLIGQILTSGSAKLKRNDLFSTNLELTDDNGNLVMLSKDAISNAQKYSENKINTELIEVKKQQPSTKFDKNAKLQGQFIPASDGGPVPWDRKKEPERIKAQGFIDSFMNTLKGQ